MSGTDPTPAAAPMPEPRDLTVDETREIDWLVRKLLVSGVHPDDLQPFVLSSIEMWREELGL